MNEANVRLWRKNKDRLMKMPRTKQADRGLKAQFPRDREPSTGTGY